MNPVLDDHAKDLVEAVQYLFGQWGWAIVGLTLLVTFRGVVAQVGAGLIWKMGRRFNENDCVIVNEFFCRINRIGLLTVEFYVYDKVNDPPERGWSWMVQNDRLHELNIWIPLDKHEPSKGIQKITQ